MNQPDQLLQKHIESVRDHYDRADYVQTKGAESYRAILAHYFNLLIPPDASVLEIGCGSGGLLSRLRCGEKTGVDVSPKQIERARERVPDARLIVSSGEALADLGKFDVIIISDTLNHAADVSTHATAGPPLRHAFDKAHPEFLQFSLEAASFSSRHARRALSKSREQLALPRRCGKPPQAGWLERNFDAAEDAVPI